MAEASERKGRERHELPPIEPLPLYPDRPSETATEFHFDALRNTMVGMLAGNGNPTPFVFLVDGKWGSGKTSLMRTVMAGLEPAVSQNHLRAAGQKSEVADGEGVDDAARKVVEDSSLRHAPRLVLESEYRPWQPPPEGSSEQQVAESRIAWLSDIIGSVDLKDAGETRTLLDREKAFFKRFRPVRRVFFNAWKYKDEAEIFPSLAHELLAAMRGDGWLAGFQALTQEVASAEWREAVAKMAEAVPYAGGALATVIERPSWLREVALYDRARPYLQALASAWASTFGLRSDVVPMRLREMLSDDVRNVMRHIRGLRSDIDQPRVNLPGIVAVFIDDLDRCPKEHVNQVLKAINLLVDMESCVFVIGADQERVAEAVEEVYRTGRDSSHEGSYGSQFLSKIVQLHLTLPEAGIEEMRDYLDSLLGEATGEDSYLQVLRSNRDLLEHGLPPNPREVKRFLNAALMRLALLRTRGRTTPDTERAALGYLLVCSELPRSLRNDVEFLVSLQEHAVSQGWSLEIPEHEGRERPTGHGKGSYDLDTLAKLSTHQHARQLLQRIDSEAWPRVLLVLGSLGTSDARLDGKLIQDLSSLGGAEPERGPVAVEPSRQELEKEREAADKKEREIRISASAFERGLRDAVVTAPEERRARALLRWLREQGERWEKKKSEEVVESLTEEPEEHLEAICTAAHEVLRLALSEKEIAERRDAMTWALVLRDAALERLPARTGKDLPEDDPVVAQLGDQPDSYMNRFWLGERSLIADQLESLPPNAELQRLLGKEKGRSWQVADVDSGEQRRMRVEARAQGAKVEEERWVLVPPGPYVAGGTVSEQELPVRVEAVPRACWVAADPVTVEGYADFVGDGYGDCSQPWWQPFADQLESVRKRGKPWEWEKQRAKRADHPVVGVSWFEAAAFCRWLNLQRLGSCDGPYRLPTEVEWEKAARGLLGRCWPWGNTWRPELVVSNEDGSPSGDELAPAASNPNLSPFAARGMAGNVWEWTSTRWRKQGFGTAALAESGKTVVAADEPMSVRGGSFNVGRGAVRCACRVWYDARGGVVGWGFRCLRDVDSP